jgi:hypothetical protein
MFALSISGIDIKTFGLTTLCSDDDNSNLTICLDANNLDKILLLDSENALNLNEIKKYVEKAKQEILELFAKFKTILYKKILNQ